MPVPTRRPARTRLALLLTLTLTFASLASAPPSALAHGESSFESSPVIANGRVEGSGYVVFKLAYDGVARPWFEMTEWHRSGDPVGQLYQVFDAQLNTVPVWPDRSVVLGRVGSNGESVHVEAGGTRVLVQDSTSEDTENTAIDTALQFPPDRFSQRSRKPIGSHFDMGGGAGVYYIVAGYAYTASGASGKWAWEFRGDGIELLSMHSSDRAWLFDHHDFSNGTGAQASAFIATVGAHVNQTLTFEIQDTMLGWFFAKTPNEEWSRDTLHLAGPDVDQYCECSFRHLKPGLARAPGAYTLEFTGPAIGAIPIAASGQVLSLVFDVQLPE